VVVVLLLLLLRRRLLLCLRAERPAPGCRDDADAGR